MGRVQSRLDRWLEESGRRLGVAIVVALGATFVLGLLTPMYTDEIGFKLQVIRIFDEGGKMVSLLPQCTSSHVLPVPISWWPGALVYATLRPVALLGLKLSGVLLAFVWIALGGGLVAGHGPGRMRRVGFFTASQALGVVPFGLVMARAEGTLLVCLAVFAAFGVHGWFDRRETKVGRVVALTGFAVTVSLFYLSHSKTVLFTPFVFVAAWLGFRKGHPVYRVTALAVVVVTAAQTYFQARRATLCPEVPWIENVYGLLVMSPSLARRDPGQFVTQGFANIANTAAAIVKDMALAKEYPAGWLPPVEDVARGLSGAAAGANIVIRGGLIALIVMAAIAPLALLATRAWRRGTPEARVSALLSVTLFGCLGGHMFFAKHWPFYHSPLAVPLLALILSFAANALGPQMPQTFRLFAKATCTVACALAVGASVVVLVHMAPRLFAIASASRTGTLLPLQPASVPPLRYGREREAIRAHAARCGLRGDGQRKLVVDDATLYAFDGLVRPVHLVYVSDATMWGVSMPGEKNEAFLRELGVSGLITRCTYIPAALASKVIRDDRGYCCLGPL